MACWSPENATNAYLQALRMGRRGKEPDVAEFISAMAAGTNAQLMVMACVGHAGPTALALVAAARQTGGRVACIFHGVHELEATRDALARYSDGVEFRIGDAQALLQGDYKGADFVIVDCEDDDCEGVFRAAQEGGSALVVGYNALHKGTWGSQVKGEVLPIGEGLVVARLKGTKSRISRGRRGSHWVVKVDECTGEEHVYRIGLPKRREIEA